MLVLSRRVGEQILIGDDVVITIVDLRSDNVRVGIDAPSSVDVNRAEVIRAIEESNRLAADAQMEPEDVAAELGVLAKPSD